MSAERLALIRAALESGLQPLSLELEDESHLHAGHAGARDGRGHYRVRVVSDVFAGQPPLARHRIVYGALGTLMQSDIHALSIQAMTGAEARQVD